MMFDDTRRAWDAAEPDYPMEYVPPAARLGRMWHWAGGPPGLFGKEHTSCLAQVKAWQTQHRAKGWGDIGYNALICVHAHAIIGRGIDYLGAHCRGYNHDRYGIQFMVGVGEDVTPAMFERAQQLTRDLDEHTGHPIDDNVHKDGYATTCPGLQITQWVRAGGPQNGDDMTTDDSVRQIVREELAKVPARVWAHQLPDPRDPTGEASTSASSWVRMANLKAGRAGDGVDALTAAVAAALDAHVGTGPVAINRDDLEAAMRTVLGSLDDAQDTADAAAGP